VSSVGIDQRLGEQVPLDAVFRDEEDNPVRLGRYFGSKPVVLTLVYYKCPMLCSEVLNGLLDSLRKLPFEVGDRFTVVTVSFDPRETPSLAAAKKATYVEQYGRPGAANGWHFLTGDPETILRLTTADGFRYMFDAKSQQYAHGSGIMVLTQEGRLARYFYGIQYSPRDLRLGLVEASASKIGSPIDQVLLLCYDYDPSTGIYSFAILNLVRLAGALTVLALGMYMIVMWRRDRKKCGMRTATTTG
jgi:protein SCO1/2